LWEQDPNYYCSVACTPGSEEVRWFGHSCADNGAHCPPLRTPHSEMSPEKGRAIEAALKKERDTMATIEREKSTELERKMQLKEEEANARVRVLDAVCVCVWVYVAVYAVR
jgi:hypothetical protein